MRVMDMRRARSYGFEPSVPFEQGIRETMEWYRTNKDVVSKRYNVFTEKTLT